MLSKYDSINRNDMNYALKCTNNHVIVSINCMLLGGKSKITHTYKLCNLR